MESDSNSEATQFVSEMQEGIGHAHSRDLEPSNSSESERFHDEYKSSSDVLKHSSAYPTPTSETSPIASDNLIIIKPENQAVPAARVFNYIPQPSEPDKILPTFSEEPKSTEANQPALSEKTGSPESNQPSLSTKTGSPEVNHLALSEKTGSPETNQPALSTKTGSPEVNQLALSEKTGSPETNQRALSAKTGSSEANQPALSEKIGSSEVNQTALSENTESETFCEKLVSAESNQPTIDDETELDEDYSKYFSDYKETDTNLDFIGFKIDSYLSKNPYKKVKEYAVESSNSEENFSSSLRPVKKQEAYSTRLNRGKNVIIMPNGYVIVNPNTQYRPSFEMPPLSPPKKNSSEECVQVFTPARELEVPSDLYLKITLKSLFCMFKDLVEKGLKKYSDSSEQTDVVDIIDNSKTELRYGIAFLKQMNNRIYALLKAVIGLPDSIFFNPSSKRGISVRASLRDTGFKLQNKIQHITIKVEEDYKKIVAVLRSNGNCKPEFDKEVVATVSKMFQECFKDVSANFATLETDIQNFRERIYFFTTEIDNLINRD